MKYIGGIIMIFCLSTSCKTKEVMSPNEYEGSKLVLSHGGGFTGAFTTFCLLDNGQLFKSENKIEATNPMNGLDRETVDQIFSNYKTLGLDEAKMESYGNLNYSVKMIAKDGSEHKLAWAKGQEGTEKFQLFYRNIMNFIQLNNSDNRENDSNKANK
jgi:hypothetical protein